MTKQPIAKKALPAFTVGEEVILDHWAMKRRSTGTVTKVGPKLVHVADKHGDVRTYRRETGAINDNYGHSRIYNQQQWADLEAENAANQRLRDLRIRFDHGSRKLSTALKNQIADLVEADIAEAQGSDG